jgi:hypothetical protein
VAKRDTMDLQILRQQSIGRNRKTGLTFVEWCDAAGYDLVNWNDRSVRIVMLKAWRLGEDPSEHRAESDPDC